VADRWSFYWRALGANNFTGWDGPGAPFPGFWRFRWNRKGLWIPCATWDRRNGAVECVIGSARPSPADVQRFDEVTADAVIMWADHFIWASPVREDQYRHAVETARWWDTLIASAAANDGRAGVVVADIRKAEPIGPTPPAKKGGK